jgi:hypothetical protein
MPRPPSSSFVEMGSPVTALRPRRSDRHGFYVDESLAPPARFCLTTAGGMPLMRNRQSNSFEGSDF